MVSKIKDQALMGIYGKNNGELPVSSEKTVIPHQVIQIQGVLLGVIQMPIMHIYEVAFN
ncbi:hypothetical protein I3842_01G132000 [Carya illinoinensis]|uniref:Uncharacterized protein n=1 Tax=Carya illinoinensis TaxID=32201 RepID=A0A922K489_CARIL|nr:hypothetical protein I3842_01G132000 [Carya illinoinensis]